jgi:transcription termination factor NusB
LEKKVSIDQAIVNAKNYSEKNSYKFINAILDKIL